MPNQPQFPGQHRDEQIIFKRRRHWYILLKWLAPSLMLLLVTVGIGVGIGFTLALGQRGLQWLWVGMILVLSAVPLGLSIWRFLDWENDHYILTNRRVLHIERVYFLFESRKEANLDKIQDVTVRMPSLIANLLYFGNVEIETASTAGQIRFGSVPEPRLVQQLIFKEAGLPKANIKEAREWEASQLRIMRPLEIFARMLYPVYPRGGDVQVWRKHWFILVRKMLRPLLATLLLVVAWIAILLSDLRVAVEPIPELVIVVVPAMFLLVLIGWIAWITIDWHNDLYVLTDTYVLDIEKRPFTSEFRREANLGMIQNVSYTQPTFLAKLLDFGNARLETAGRMGEFTFDSVPNPRRVQEEITQRLANFRRRSAQAKPKPAPKTEDELAQALERILSERYGLFPQPPNEQN